MCVDDDPEILELIELILTNEGYEVKALRGPEDLFRQIREFRPDLIMLDINLYGENGLDVCKMIVSNPPTEHIPVIMISADNSIYTATERYGASDIVLKPFDIDYLTATVGKFLTAKIIPLSPRPNKGN